MTRSLLERLVAPIGAAAFLEHHWAKRSVFLHGDAPRLGELAPDDSWLLRASEVDAAIVDGAGRQRQVRIAPADAPARYAGGFTICASVSAEPAVAALLTELAYELGLAGAPFAKLYSSPDDRGFAIHFDSFHVFVVQLRGAKRWRFSATPAVEAPLGSGKLDATGRPVWSRPDGTEEPILTDDGEPIAAPDLSAFEEAELRPGDCLYLPPGTWHVARARGHSVAISLSPPRASVFSLVSRALEDHLTRSATWRRDAFTIAPFDGTGKVPEPLVRQFDESLSALRGLLDGLDARTIHRVWRLNVPRPRGGADAEKAIAPGDALAHKGEEVKRYLVASHPGGPEQIYFYGDDELSLPIERLRFVEELAKTPRFALEEAYAWDPSLAKTDVEEILTDLLRAGLLRRCD